jgi:hypothetical protein
MDAFVEEIVKSEERLKDERNNRNRQMGLSEAICLEKILIWAISGGN